MSRDDIEAIVMEWCIVHSILLDPTEVETLVAAIYQRAIPLSDSTH